MKTKIETSILPANTGHAILDLTARKAFRFPFLLLLIASLVPLTSGRVVAQGGLAVWGEVKINDSNASTASKGVTIVLYRAGSGEVGRQSVSSGGRYRFTNLRAGEYEITVEDGTNEIARVRLDILSGAVMPFYGFRQDFEFVLKPNSGISKPTVNIISAADAYARSPVNKSLFQKAEEAVGKKKYEQAVALLRQIIDSDKLDFQVWTLLGTVYLVQEKSDDAEKSYLSALEARPTFALALLNLGRLRSTQKKFAESIDPLTRAVEAQPQSAEANLLLGEAYLQTKKGSKAVPYLNEAARLGRADAHLRLGWLYNAAGLKDMAALEYEEFLRKKPDYPDRKKLQEYINANKKA